MAGASGDSFLAPGSESEVRLEESFLDGKSSFCSLRHDFLPASVDTNSQAQLILEGDKVKLQYQDGSGALADGKLFHGVMEASKDDLDCALIYDGSNWRLELVSSIVNNLRSVKSPGQTPMRDHLPQVGDLNPEKIEGPMDEVGMHDRIEAKELAEDESQETFHITPDYNHEPGDEMVGASGRNVASSASVEALQELTPRQEENLNSESGNGPGWSTDEDDSSGQRNKNSPAGGINADQEEVKTDDTLKVGSLEVMGDPSHDAHEITGAPDPEDEQDMEIDDFEAALCNPMEEEEDEKHSCSHKSLNDDNPVTGKDDGNEIEQEMLSIMAMDPDQSDTLASSAEPSKLPKSQSHPSGSSPTSLPSQIDPADTTKQEDTPIQLSDQDAVVVTAPNDMEKDFFMDHDMDIALPSPHHADPTPNGNVSGSSSSSSSSSSSDSSSSSGEEPAAGEPMSEPEVDVF